MVLRDVIENRIYVEVFQELRERGTKYTTKILLIVEADNSNPFTSVVAYPIQTTLGLANYMDDMKIRRKPTHVLLMMFGEEYYVSENMVKGACTTHYPPKISKDDIDKFFGFTTPAVNVNPLEGLSTGYDHSDPVGEVQSINIYQTIGEYRCQVIIPDDIQDQVDHYKELMWQAIDEKQFEDAKVYGSMHKELLARL